MDFLTQWVTIFQPAINQAIADDQAVTTTCSGGNLLLILLPIGALVIALIAIHRRP